MAGPFGGSACSKSATSSMTARPAALMPSMQPSSSFMVSTTEASPSSGSVVITYGRDAMGSSPGPGVPPMISLVVVGKKS